MSVFVFDGDDTLWYVEWLYSQAYADFFSYLYKALEHRVPNIHFVYKTFFAIEAENAKTWGIRRGRVAATMATTYQKLCEWIHACSGENLYAETEELKIRAIGDQPFDITQHHWIPGAERTLTGLLQQGHELCLLTKYDRVLWPEKAAMLRISRFFNEENIRTVDSRKHMEDFLAVSHAYERCTGSLIAVGNSEGDLLPVTLSDLWHGFYIPLATTFPLDKDTNPTEINFEPHPYNHPRVTTLRSIQEIFNHV